MIVAACSSSPTSTAATRFAATSRAPLPATAPHLLMSGTAAGWAIWPSAESWVLLHTADGWRHVTNATPVAVPTGGGLVAAASPSSITVAVGAYERLTRSPLLSRVGDVGSWVPAELPGPVTNARNAVSVAAARTTVVLSDAGGSLVARTNGDWARLTDAATLSPGEDLRLDGVTWASATVGWLTGHGRAGRPMAFQTNDGGRDWAPVSTAAGSAVAALAPCGDANHWLLPVVTADGTMRVSRTTDGGRSWATGSALSLPAESPAWGCRGEQVWLSARAGSVDHVFASHDGGAVWTDAGRAPDGLTDLTPVGGGNGYAASTTSAGAKLWTVSGDGAHFAEVPLPAWVARLGASMSTS